MNEAQSLSTALLLALLLASPASAYVVVLNDGSQVMAREELVIEGDQAIITLQNGTRTSIAASEIDLESTRTANAHSLGSARMIEDGTTTQLPSSAAPPPKRERLPDLIARRDADLRGLSLPSHEAADEAAHAASPVTDFRVLQRRPFRNTEVAEELQRFFRAQGVEEILIYQGSQGDHVRLDAVTSSEASVFRALQVAASTLLHLDETYARQVAAIELVLETADRQPAGQFLIGQDAARLLAEQRIEPSEFFIRYVRF
jgi:hypothetical protein